MASESESEKRETLADIVAELRSITFAMKVHDAMMPDVHDILCDVASRIEAAWKREMTEAEANALAVGGLVEAERQRVVVSKKETTTIGNAAALREAVVALLDALDSLGCDESTATLAAFVPDMADSSARCLAAFRKAKEALSAPARQCDVGTPEEQYRRHDKFCDATRNGMSGYHCEDAPRCVFCFSKWSQTPYVAEEGAGK